MAGCGGCEINPGVGLALFRRSNFGICGGGFKDFALHAETTERQSEQRNPNTFSVTFEEAA